MTTQNITEKTKTEAAVKGIGFIQSQKALPNLYLLMGHMRDVAGRFGTARAYNNGL